jgi:hypothetical protein
VLYSIGITSPKNITAGGCQVDARSEEVRRQASKLKEMIGSMLFGIEERIRLMEIQRDQLYFFQEELEEKGEE